MAHCQLDCDGRHDALNQSLLASPHAPASALDRHGFQAEVREILDRWVALYQKSDIWEQYNPLTVRSLSLLSLFHLSYSLMRRSITERRARVYRRLSLTGSTATGWFPNPAINLFEYITLKARFSSFIFSRILRDPGWRERHSHRNAVDNLGLLLHSLDRLIDHDRLRCGRLDNGEFARKGCR